MPSFDVVSEVNVQEVRNAVDQTNRELGTRFDFKGLDVKVELGDGEMTVRGPQEFHLQQIQEVLRQKLAKRGVDVTCLEESEPQIALNAARQVLKVRQGIESDLAKRIVKDIKASKLKVQAQIQGDQVRITGKQRDDLQQVITLLKGNDYGLPLQYQNFRD